MSQSVCDKLTALVKDEVGAQLDYLGLGNRIEGYGETLGISPPTLALLRKIAENIRADEAVHADLLKAIKRLLECPVTE